jgi:hypothetical protein
MQGQTWAGLRRRAEAPDDSGALAHLEGFLVKARPPAQAGQLAAQGVGQPAGATEPDLRLACVTQRCGAEAFALLGAVDVQAYPGQAGAQVLEAGDEGVSGPVAGAVVQACRRDVGGGPALQGLQPGQEGVMPMPPAIQIWRASGRQRARSKRP